MVGIPAVKDKVETEWRSMYRRCFMASQTLEAVAILIIIVRQKHPDQEGETSGKVTHAINLITVIYS